MVDFGTWTPLGIYANGNLKGASGSPFSNDYNESLNDSPPFPQARDYNDPPGHYIATVSGTSSAFAARFRNCL